MTVSPCWQFLSVMHPDICLNNEENTVLGWRDWRKSLILTHSGLFWYDCAHFTKTEQLPTVVLMSPIFIHLVNKNRDSHKSAVIETFWLSYL